jgi:hypothetical protein
MTCLEGGTGSAWKYESIYLSKSALRSADVMLHTDDSQTEANVQHSQPHLGIRVIDAHPAHRFLHLIYYRP